MESYTLISFLNDFIFCPRSIYFHQLYGATDTRLYQSTHQTLGAASHQAIDEENYSTSKDVLQGIPVYSSKYNLAGKIDIFKQKTGELIERKRQIKVIYDGYIFQVYAQYFCLQEMGYRVNKIKLYSMVDNKSHHINLPEDNPVMVDKFIKLTDKIQNYSFEQEFTPNMKKCQKCIYANLCDLALV